MSTIRTARGTVEVLEAACKSRSCLHVWAEKPPDADVPGVVPTAAREGGAS